MNKQGAVVNVSIMYVSGLNESEKKGTGELEEEGRKQESRSERKRKEEKTEGREGV